MSRIPTQPPRQREPRQKDKAYLRRCKGAACECCEATDETVVPAHYTRGRYSQARPDDALTFCLCRKCHDLLDGRESEGRGYVEERLIRKMLRDRHEEWRDR